MLGSPMSYNFMARQQARGGGSPMNLAQTFDPSGGHRGRVSSFNAKSMVFGSRSMSTDGAVGPGGMGEERTLSYRERRHVVVAVVYS